MGDLRYKYTPSISAIAFSAEPSHTGILGLRGHRLFSPRQGSQAACPFPMCWAIPCGTTELASASIG